MAIAALACSLFGIFLFLPTIPGIVFGHLAFAKVRRGEADGQGMAVAAFSVGYLTIVAWAITVPVLFNVAASQGAFR